MEDFKAERERMLAVDIAGRGVADPGVLRAIRDVPREDFVPIDLRGSAYDDWPLLIGEGQTISQPYLVALMLAAARLSPRDRVLDVGTGSGYAAAVASRIAAQVFTIERLPALAETARRRLAGLGYDNVTTRIGDGSLGWPEAAPFDAILVAAAGPDAPQALKRQLAAGGRLVMPIGEERDQQTLRRITRRGEDEYVVEDLGPVAFVPLIGAQGWSHPPS